MGQEIIRLLLNFLNRLVFKALNRSRTLKQLYHIVRDGGSGGELSKGETELDIFILFVLVLRRSGKVTFNFFFN